MKPFEFISKTYNLGTYLEFTKSEFQGSSFFAIFFPLWENREGPIFFVTKVLQ